MRLGLVKCPDQPLCPQLRASFRRCFSAECIDLVFISGTPVARGKWLHIHARSC